VGLFWGELVLFWGGGGAGGGGGTDIHVVPRRRALAHLGHCILQYVTMLG